jgi:hypothetical protein
MGTSIIFDPADAVATDTDEGEATIPGRRDLRISLTSVCNLRCAYCHNEGQAASWHQEKAQPTVTLEEIETLIEAGSKYGAKSVKFTGGDPGVYRHFFDFMSVIRNWGARYPNIEKWSMTTNDVPFMNFGKFDALVDFQPTNICFRIDSVEPEMLSKPSSALAVGEPQNPFHSLLGLKEAADDRAAIRLKVDDEFERIDRRSACARSLGVKKLPRAIDITRLAPSWSMLCSLGRRYSQTEINRPLLPTFMVSDLVVLD